jgi:hypothetical protein
MNSGRLGHGLHLQAQLVLLEQAHEALAVDQPDRRDAMPNNAHVPELAIPGNCVRNPSG